MKYGWIGLGFLAMASAASAGDDYCREFTQEVTVGNRKQEGYGTACRQEDGSWKIVKPAGVAGQRGDTITLDEPPIIRKVYVDRDPFYDHRWSRGGFFGPSWYHDRHHRKGWERNGWRFHSHSDDSIRISFGDDDWNDRPGHGWRGHGWGGHRGHGCKGRHCNH